MVKIYVKTREFGARKIGVEPIPLHLDTSIEDPDKALRKLLHYCQPKGLNAILSRPIENAPTLTTTPSADMDITLSAERNITLSTDRNIEMTSFTETRRYENKCDLPHTPRRRNTSNRWEEEETSDSEDELGRVLKHRQQNVLGGTEADPLIKRANKEEQEMDGCDNFWRSCVTCRYCSSCTMQ